MDAAGWYRGRILETVWYVGTPQTRKQVFDHVASILSNNDQLIVADCGDAVFRNLLVTSQSLLNAWSRNR